MTLRYQGATSAPRRLPGGFGQGTWLGGFLFIIKFNGVLLRPGVPRLTPSCMVKVKYIDDASQAFAVNLRSSLEADPVERPRPLNFSERHQTVLKPEMNMVQETLKQFASDAEANRFIINKGKCYAMKFSRSIKYDFPAEFKIMGDDFIEEKHVLRVLGIQIQSNLRWDAQCAQMIKRASNTIWVLRRMKELGVEEASLVNFWKAEGRVHLEMCCPLWHSCITEAQSRALARVQRVAMAAISGAWAASHSQQLSDLGLEELAIRRERLCLQFARRTAATSRHRDLFTPAAGPRFPRGPQLGPRFQEVEARTSSYYNSALPYLTRLLNGS
jgi:hypothetical protein